MGKFLLVYLHIGVINFGWYLGNIIFGKTVFISLGYFLATMMLKVFLWPAELVMLFF